MRAVGQLFLVALSSSCLLACATVLDADFDRGGDGGAARGVPVPRASDASPDVTVTVTVTPDGGEATILTQLANARLLAVDGLRLYWSDSDAGTILSAPKTGGATTTLATGQGKPAAMTVAPDPTDLQATVVYWVNQGSGEVMSVPGAGGAVTQLAKGSSPQALAARADGTQIAWTDFNGGTVSVFDPRAPMTTALTVATMESAPLGVAVNDAGVYFGDYGNGELRSFPFGQTVSTVAFGGVFSVVADDANVYWTSASSTSIDAHTSSVLSLAKGSLTPHALASNLAYPNGLILDGDRLYWVDENLQTVQSVATSGGAVSTLATESSGIPSALAVDDSSIYWLTVDSSGTGTVKRRAR